MSSKPRYRLVTGQDDDAFCQRVSEILDDGYILYGSPAIHIQGEDRTIVQALILPQRGQPHGDRPGGGDFGNRRPFRKFDDGPRHGGGDFGGGGGGGGFGDRPGGGFGGDRDRGGFDKDKPFNRRPGRF